MSSALQDPPIPKPGEIVRMRARHYLVEGVEVARPGSGPIVSAVCLDDDAQGDPLEVVWDLELEKSIVGDETWKAIGKKDFDHPRFFSAYLHTLRWNCVTATDPGLFQSPFRAGIRLEAYQLEPLRKALRLPRVNLFIADDVGLGKTIEAGLIASELLLRRRVREVVVACPPAMVPQWREEMESRFGLTFEVMDHAYIERVRREHGYSVNPWKTFPRFIVSQRLLIDEGYASTLRDWLGSLRVASLLILDEAHHAAPSSGARYAIDSRITKAVRELAPRFEHRLFLSATPHNGHSNSFSTLLALLDSQRFTPGVKVTKENLDAVMVRRIKEDLRQFGIKGLPKREPVQVDIAGLPEDAPELVLSRLLDEYRTERQQRLENATKRQKAQGELLMSGLQQRLLSSIDAFARTLKVHRQTMERIWALPTPARPKSAPPVRLTELNTGASDPDEDESQQPEELILKAEDAAFTLATEQSAGDGVPADTSREWALLDQMQSIADAHRSLPDARIRALVEWIRQHQCAGAVIPGQGTPAANATWTDLRLLIFTEYEDTRRYVWNMLRDAFRGTRDWERRIEVFHGPTSPEKREHIKRAFNQPAHETPLRILLATDAAREGLNLQAQCHNLFHFDVPWNPSRLEQRNGRIDRKMQPQPVVYCHYFVYQQRPEDRVLRALVRKTETIKRELGSLSQVLENRLAETIRFGIDHASAQKMALAIETTDLDQDKKTVVLEELEVNRERQEALTRQINALRTRLDASSAWINFNHDHFRDAISCALEMNDAKPLLPAGRPRDGAPERYAFPDLNTSHGGDPRWTATLDTLRPAPSDGERNDRWRKDAAIRPVVFEAGEELDEDVVQLHLSHRLAQRLLSRFLAQGFVQHDLSRACLSQSRDAIPRVILLGRLSLYGAGAVRLHEEVVAVTARWVEPAARKGSLKPFAQDEGAETKTLDLLEQAIAPGARQAVPANAAAKLRASIPSDISDLLPHLAERGQRTIAEATAQLATRGKAESDALLKVLEDQRKRVRAELGNPAALQMELFSSDERRQVEANRKYWEKWLLDTDRDLREEPQRIQKFYTVTSTRLEPVGLAYLWPVSG